MSKAGKFLPALWPVFLLLLGQLNGQLFQRHAEQRQVERELVERRRHLEGLRAKTVAGRLEQRDYQALLKEFAVVTRLQASDPFLPPESSALASTQVASLVNALQGELVKMKELDVGGETLEFLPVVPGPQQRLGPFTCLEFGLELRGTFRALPDFLRLLSRLSKSRHLAISIGELRLDSRELDPLTGEGLRITLPVRAYVRD